MNIKELSHLLYATYQSYNNKRHLSTLAQRELRKFLRTVLTTLSDSKQTVRSSLDIEAPLILGYCYGVAYNPECIEGYIKERLAKALAGTEPTLPLAFWERVVEIEVGQP
jgi:hypothetical protein